MPPLQLLSNLRSTRLLALQDEHNGEKGEDDHRMVKSALHCLMMLDAKETSAKLFDIIWLDNVNNYDLLQLTGLRI